MLAVLLIAGEVALGRSSTELATWPDFVIADDRRPSASDRA